MPKPSDYDKTHLRNMAAIGTRLDRIFKKAADEAAKIGVQIKSLHPEHLFSFDDYPETKKQIERLMAALQQSTTAAIASGIRQSWTLSNNKNNTLAQQVLCDQFDALTEAQRKRYFSTNEAALQAFLQRKTAGLNLSDRVWRYTHKFKEEIELGLDLGIRSGKPAAEMARDLRQYLRHPDMMFRKFRVREENGDAEEGVDKKGYGRKWKRRVTDPVTGKVTWENFNPRDFHPGQGVYRSSYKNARRLAVTETNIAYRTSDHLRWQQMDFVVGIRIALSNNHTLNGVAFTDICDRLSSTKPGDGKGLYPKDFKFVGWHPHCRCHVETVLKTEEEMEADTQRILNGEPTTTDSVNTVRDTPAEYKQFAHQFNARNEERAANGLRPLNTPYFIRDNRGYFDRAIGLKKTVAQMAAERHAARPPEQIQDILDRWEARKHDPLVIAANRHAARTPEDIKRIQDAWNEKLERDRKTRLVAGNVFKVADREWDLSLDPAMLQAMRDAIASGNLTQMSKLTKSLVKDIQALQVREKALADIIPNPRDLRSQFSISELETVKVSILNKLDEFKAKGWGDFDTKTNLAHLKHSLEWQANYMATKGQFKYKTWEVAQHSYLKLVDKAQDLLEWENIATDIKALQGFKTTSKDFINYLDKAIAAQAAGDKKTAQFYVYNAGLKKDALEAARAKSAATRAAKAGGAPAGAVKFGDECFTEKRRKAALIFKSAIDAENSYLFDEAARLYQAASDAFKEAAEEYTQHSGYLTKWLRGLDGYLESSMTYAQMAERHAKALSEVIAQTALKKDMWLYRDERAAFLMLKAGGFDPDKLQAQIEEYTRKITARYNKRCKVMTAKQKKELAEKIEWFTNWRARQLIGRHGIDPSILSCGTHCNHRFCGTGGDNKYGVPKVRLEIFCPKGTQALYAAPYNSYNPTVKKGKYWDGKSHTISIHEAEIFLQRDTEYRIIDARWDAAEDRWFIKVEVIAHHARDIEMQSTPDGYKAKFK